MTFKFNEYEMYLQLNYVIANDLPVVIGIYLIHSHNYSTRKTVIPPSFSLNLM